jgi:uncharacterized protein (DUF1800 family)
MSVAADRLCRHVAMRGLGTAVLFIGAVAAVSCASRPRAPSPSPSATETIPLASASDSGRELTADQQVLQALDRLTFGPRPGDVAHVREIGVDRWMAQQLTPDRVPDQAADALVANVASYTLPMRTLEVEYPPGRRALAAQRRSAMMGQGAAPLSREDSNIVRSADRASAKLVADVQSLKVARALVSERQLQEVMVDFWENHFTVYDRKGAQMRYYLAAYDRDAIRPYALGRFRDLLGAVAKSPAMLFYLDNWESVADSTEPTLAPRPMPRPFPRGQQTLAIVPGAVTPIAPRRPARGLNENYGRELLELHTLGVDGGYTQQDVIDVARALTGWSIDRRPNQEGGNGFIFRPAFHDAGPKVVLGHSVAAGRGIEDGEEVLDIVARHPSTARFIATKLCRRFVSDSPPPALVARAAATFTRTDGDIRQVLWTILTSPEFFSRPVYRAKVKSPFELVVSALRAVNAEPDTTQRTAQLIARMGEPIFGHQAPNGYPETGESWMNTGAILNRINFGLAVASSRVPGASIDRWPNAGTLMTAPRAVQVDAVVTELLGGSVSPDTRAILTSGDHPLLSAMGSAPSVARAGGGGEPSAAIGEPPSDGMTAVAGAGGDMVDAQRRRRVRGEGSQLPALQGLAQVVGLALGAPEFQRR